MTRTFLSYADRFLAWRTRQIEQRRAALTRRFLENLPADIQSDIGWPGETAQLVALPEIENKPNMATMIARAERSV